MIVHPLINPKIISSKDGLTATVIAAKKSFAHFAAVFLKRHHKMQAYKILVRSPLEREHLHSYTLGTVSEDKCHNKK